MQDVIDIKPGLMALLALVVMSVLPAMAAEKLDFNAAIGAKTRLDLNHYIQNTLKTTPDSLEIAPADLNGDGLAEYILKDKNCAAEAQCRYTILAETQNGFLQLGQTQAKNLMLGDDTVQGVRNLMVFQNDTNDFDYALYTWQPEAASYNRKAP